MTPIWPDIDPDVQRKWDAEIGLRVFFASLAWAVAVGVASAAAAAVVLELLA